MASGRENGRGKERDHDRRLAVGGSIFPVSSATRALMRATRDSIAASC